MSQSEPEKIEKAKILRGPDLLKLLPPDTKLFDNVSSSESHASELSGPFSEVVYNVEAESKRKAKELYGKDLYTAFAFSPEFKTAMEQLKKEMIRENPDYLKTDSMVAETEAKSEPEEEKESEFVLKLPQFPGIDFEVEPKEEVQEDKKSGKEKKKVLWQEEDESMFDTMSGYWRLLSVFDEFKISPPWYDAYAEGKEHWLNTKPINPDVLENSRKKCLNWLSKYFDT